LDKGDKNAISSANHDVHEAELKKTVTGEKPKGNKGILIVDATVADQMIAYPADLDLLSGSREESKRLIDELCKILVINNKPRTYRRLTRKQYLNVAKKKNKTKNELRKAIGQQLRYLRRNLKSIEGLFHIAFGWQVVLTFIPYIFIQSFIVQKIKNSWVGVIMHGGLNGPSFMAICFGLI
jgi:hypothetical protein